MNNKGFTLAEVLITLGIIGVVAAMTLPALINRTQAKELETGLQKAYSVIQAAYNQMIYDEGQNVAHNYEPATFILKFKEYFKVVKYGGSKGIDTPTTDETGMQYYSTNYKTYTNNKLQNNLFDDGQVIISDGMLILIENSNTGDIYISVDVNGINKKPNRWGHDLFTFQIMDNGKLIPMGAEGTAYPKSYCSATSTNTRNGAGCTYEALTNKDYFKNLPK